MSINTAEGVLNDLNIDYMYLNNILKVQHEKYSYIISFNDDESQYNIYTFNENENENVTLDFSMTLYPMHFMHTKTYFEKWFNGVKDVITLYYMDKGI